MVQRERGKQDRPRKQEKREIILALNVSYQQVVERHFGVHAGALAD